MVSCSVCFEPYGCENVARILKNCGHDLCGRCIFRLLEARGVRARCPECRTPVLDCENSEDHLRILKKHVLLSGNRILVKRQTTKYSPMDVLFPVCLGLSNVVEVSRLNCGDSADADLVALYLKAAPDEALCRELESRSAKEHGTAELEALSLAWCCVAFILSRTARLSRVVR